MTDKAEHFPHTSEDPVRNILRAHPSTNDPQPVDYATNLRTSMEAARQRMHIHARKNLSHQAIASSLPNLINLVHFEQASAYDPLSGDSRDMAAFTLWTIEGHVMMADGSLARRPGAGDALPEDHEGFVVVDDEEMNSYNDVLKRSLSKTIERVATTMAVPVEDQPTKWVDRKVTRALLRQTRHRAHPDSAEAHPEV